MSDNDEVRDARAKCEKLRRRTEAQNVVLRHQRLLIKQHLQLIATLKKNFIASDSVFSTTTIRSSHPG
jgi:hypothetical protein